MMIRAGKQEAKAAVATLFSTRWLEDAAGASLEAADMELDRHRSVLSLVNALHAGKAEVAIVEDEGDQLEACMAALKFRGTSPVPLIAIGKGSSKDMAAALRCGACDYAVIGEAMETFVARVRARVELLRDYAQPPSLKLGPCELDSASRALLWPTGEANLTWREFNIAWLLFQHAGHVVNLRTFSSQVWGRDVSVAKRTIEQHVSRLRRKLLNACGTSDERLELHAVNNVGYRLALEAADKIRTDRRRTPRGVGLAARLTVDDLTVPELPN